MACFLRQSVCLLLALVVGLMPLTAALAAGGVASGMPSTVDHVAGVQADKVDGMVGDCQQCTDQCCEQGVCSGISCGACVAGILPGAIEVAVLVPAHTSVVDLPTAVPCHPSVLYRPPRA
ncbi:hypothetical protein [endosymbiont of unidentified scaly snail isolate Monju]|uniref:hypothetical protein n=1 Tax=endosymbiont of unidentified scaly snail isolate Monju TaxID=1248727 RepID=UPI0005BE3264|nr:hypothetical protein [endosymbiont of unidentified scaly snail isolate Monju]